MKPSRLEAFSDGVFAVAITLLVFNLKVPAIIASAHHDLGRQIAHDWPSYFAYLMSFLSIGICWVNHHSIFDRVEIVDRALLFTNLGLLLGIASIPFSTSLAAAWYNQGSDGKTAVAIYCGIWVYTSIFFMLIIYHLMAHEHLSVVITGVTLKSLKRKGFIGLAIYLIATGLSFVSPITAFLICFCLGIYYIFGIEQESVSTHNHADLP